MITVLVISLVVMIGLSCILLKKNIELEDRLMRLDFEKFMQNIGNDLDRDTPAKPEEETKGFLQ